MSENESLQVVNGCFEFLPLRFLQQPLWLVVTEFSPMVYNNPNVVTQKPLLGKKGTYVGFNSQDMCKRQWAAVVNFTLLTHIL